jgi:hypothetical protein
VRVRLGPERTRDFHRTVLLMREGFAADERCHEAPTTPVVMAEGGSMPPAFVGNGVEAWQATGGSVCRTGPKRPRRAALRLALVAAIMAGAAWAASGLTERTKMADRHGHARSPVALRSDLGSPAAEAQPGSHTSHRSHKRFHKFPKRPAVNDPSDDGTSRDSDDEDDDASDDLNCDDDTEGIFVACLGEIALYVIATESAGPASRIEPHFPLFLTLQRLRC